MKKSTAITIIGLLFVNNASALSVKDSIHLKTNLDNQFQAAPAAKKEDWKPLTVGMIAAPAGAMALAGSAAWAVHSKASQTYVKWFGNKRVVLLNSGTGGVIGGIIFITGYEKNPALAALYSTAMGAFSTLMFTAHAVRVGGYVPPGKFWFNTVGLGAVSGLVGGLTAAGVHSLLSDKK